MPKDYVIDEFGGRLHGISDIMENHPETGPASSTHMEALVTLLQQQIERCHSSKPTEMHAKKNVMRVERNGSRSSWRSSMND